MNNFRNKNYIINIVSNIEFRAYKPRKLHPCIGIVFKNWRYVQFEKINKEVLILRIKGLEIYKLD